MRTFKYFCIYSKNGQMKLMEDDALSEEKILGITSKYPACVSMGIEQRFLFLLSKWNSEQTHPTIRYFYGPLEYERLRDINENKPSL